MEPSSPLTPSTPTRAFRQLARGGRRYALPWLSPGRWRRRFLLVGAAFLASLISIVFAIGANYAIDAHHGLMQQAPWLTLFVAPAGFALMAWIARKFFPGTQGSGIPQAIAASLTDDANVRRHLLSVRIAIAKVLLTLGGLLAGAGIGREGPTVQVAASMMNLLAGRRHGRVAPSRDLIVAGSGAGIAAAFNTPLGGIMFAIEEMCRYRAFRANSTTLLAVVLAGLTSLVVLGNYTYFGRTPATLTWSSAVWPLLMCGALGGLLGGFATRAMLASARGLPGQVGVFAREHPIRFAAACGLATGLVGLVSGGLTYGTGYAESKAALEGASALPVYFFAAKLLVIWLAFVSGIPGGIFAPSLAVGAGIGTDVALLLSHEQSAPILLLGMVSFLSGITQSPITAFVIVMEMTANTQMLLPLMAASMVAHAFAKSVAPTPLYDALAIGMLRRFSHHGRPAEEAKAADTGTGAPP